MKIIDLYSTFHEAFVKAGKKGVAKILKSHPHLKQLHELAQEWEHNLENVERWLTSPEYRNRHELAKRFIKKAQELVETVEQTLEFEMPGELRLSPSLMRFDGFARYDSGSHMVWFGVDHPDANDDYLKVLLAHELSHVYRDHQPAVWGFLKKPLEKVTRAEYLDALTAREHLASEGLATLFSQVVYPQVPMPVHHYYAPEEMQWCFENFDKIDKAIHECLVGDQDVWTFYMEDRVTHGSPSRTQYFWAAQKIKKWVEQTHPGQYKERLIELHGMHSDAFECF